MKRNSVSSFGETIFIFCEKDFCTIWILWTGFVTGEFSFWYNVGFFWLDCSYQLCSKLHMKSWLKPTSQWIRFYCVGVELTRYSTKKSACSLSMHIVYIRCSCTASNHSHLLVSRRYKDEKQILHEIQANEIITHIVKEGFCFTHEQHPM